MPEIDDIRPVTWHDGAVRIIDQTALPAELTYLDLTRVDALIAAIQRLAVRGAPALGVAGAYGVALAVLTGETDRIPALRAARPTAVNLAVGADRVAARLAEGFEAVLAEAHAVLTEDLTANRTLSVLGADWLLTRIDRRPLRLLTHCNAGALATGGWGTALGVVRELHARGLVEVVYVDETRPLLQGTRLTAWELARLGIPHRIQADGAAASTIVSAHVDAAVVGADRIAANGDTANKIGTLGVALACAHARIPFMVAAPTSTIDPATPTGAAIHVEQRAESELLTPAAPDTSRAHNPAFDVTPAQLVSALTTERGLLEPAHGDLPAQLWTP
ncbi:MAG TPA: S-methyl-5-thioribose-1-phosphate isomerase [Actinospica sp.]|nr:S-methyl-5-thioribose-1-phosphate isomerase [Actinospica sp.]